MKRKSLYLYLALACFLGIILIFIFDGYIGVYDRLLMDNGQYKQTVESDQWAQQEKYGGMVSVGVERGGQVDFTYTIENHRFSKYTADMSITLWQNKAQIGDIHFIPEKPIMIPAFDKEEVNWSIKPSEIFPAGYPPEQSHNIIMKINRGDIEREVNVNIYVSPDGIKIAPPPVPQ